MKIEKIGEIYETKNEEDQYYRGLRTGDWSNVSGRPIKKSFAAELEVAREKLEKEAK